MENVEPKLPAVRSIAWLGVWRRSEGMLANEKLGGESSDQSEQQLPSPVDKQHVERAKECACLTPDRTILSKLWA